jgi:hypothetical protein
MDLLDETRAKLQKLGAEMLTIAKQTDDMAAADALRPEFVQTHFAMLEHGQSSILTQMAVICGCLALMRDGKTIPPALG